MFLTQWFTAFLLWFVPESLREKGSGTERQAKLLVGFSAFLALSGIPFAFDAFNSQHNITAGTLLLGGAALVGPDGLGVRGHSASGGGAAGGCGGCDGSGEAGAGGNSCQTADDCEDGYFCKYPEASCGENSATGECTRQRCRGRQTVDQVCGCDGMTYMNECKANEAGVSLAAQGACDPGGRPRRGVCAAEERRRGGLAGDGAGGDPGALAALAGAGRTRAGCGLAGRGQPGPGAVAGGPRRASARGLAGAGRG